MRLNIYLIRGRGEQGDKFQLGRVVNEQGHYYKGEYDPTHQFSNMEELTEMLAEMVKVDATALQLLEINL